MALLLGMIVLAATPLYLGLQAVAIFGWRGDWRLAGLVPLAPALPVVWWCLEGYRQQSDLWPLPFVFFAPLGVLYLLAVLLVRCMGRRPAI